MVLQTDSSIKLINTIEERKDLMSKTGLDHLIIHPFTKSFSRLTALEFVRDILVNKLNIKKIVIGYDHRFGRNRNANIEDLKSFGLTYGFDVEEISAQQLDEVAVSSTKIRNALKVGDIKTANTYLGYSFMLSGTLIKGKEIGRTIQYPTANIQLSQDYKLVPKEGVYAVQSIIDNKLVYGLTSIGTNPTVGGTLKTIETHFLDFNDNLYGKNLTIEFLSHIRGEKTFGSIDALKSAIQNDEVFARNFLKNHA
jgi:riboflavin kinase/FMN adenylyltransferase